MERKIEFNVTGKERGLLVKAIGEFLGVEVRYLRVPTCNYDIGGSILDRSGVFIPTDKMSDRQVELLAEQFLENGGDGREADRAGEVLSISVPREMFSDSACGSSSNSCMTMWCIASIMKWYISSSIRE